MVGIGTTTPASKLHVNGSITASSFVSSGGTSSQYLMADGSTSSLAALFTNTASMLFRMFNSDRTFNYLKAGNGMTISLPIYGPQTTLTFSVAAILPTDTLTGKGASLKINSNYMISKDDSNNTVMQIASSGAMLTKDLDVPSRALFCDRLATDTITPSGNTLHLTGNVDFRDTNNNVVITVQPAVGVGVL